MKISEHNGYMKYWMIICTEKLKFQWNVNERKSNKSKKLWAKWVKGRWIKGEMEW